MANKVKKMHTTWKYKHRLQQHIYSKTKQIPIKQDKLHGFGFSQKTNCEKEILFY